MPPRDLHTARSTLASTVATRRAERSALWQDSTLFQDSFFAPDNRMEGFGNSEFSGLPGAMAAARAGSSNGSGGSAFRPTEPPEEDIAGIVVDTPKFTSQRH